MAALAVAALGFAGVAASLVVNGWLERRRLFAEQLAIAFDRFKETQRRSAGVASLAALRASSPRFWTYHDKAVRDFLYAQSVYLLCHGSNRFQAHEIANLRQILSWIVPSDPGRSELADWQQQGLHDAARRYLRQAGKDSPIDAEADGESRDERAIDSFAIDSLADELRDIQERMAKPSTNA